MELFSLIHKMNIQNYISIDHIIRPINVAQACDLMRYVNDVYLMGLIQSLPNAAHVNLEPKKNL